MRILLSAYACEPGKGSEPGVGWHWATELARLGHEVVVITRSNNRASIEKALADAPIIGLHFYYYDLPSWGKWWKRGPWGVHLYYWLWQQGAYRLAKRLTTKMQFDLVHHVTFGVFRQPSYMGRLGLPFVIGPLGGGETTPVSLRGSFPAKIACGEMLREVSNKLACWNPFVFAMFRQATLIFCRTQDTLDMLPVAFRNKSYLHREIGLETERIKQEATPKVTGANFLYVGSLVYMKGIHLAMKAFAELRKDRLDATFTVIGNGRDEARLKSISLALGLGESVRWLGRVSHEEIWAHYCCYTAFVFPSFHDSGGTVLLEALSQGLPVICLDTGGPGAVIPTSCGIKVPVKNRSEAEVVGDLKAAMQRIADDPELQEEMGRQALEVARVSTWKDVVSSTYMIIENVLDASSKAGTNRGHSVEHLGQQKVL